MRSFENYKEFANVAKAAKSEIKAGTKSILFCNRVLNKMAVKNEFCNNTSVKDVAELVKAMLPVNVSGNMKAREFFHACVFTKDYQGRACLVRAYKGTITLQEIQAGDIVTDKGRELVINKAGDGLCVLQPITLTPEGVFSAFCTIVGLEVKAEEKARKAAEKARKAANKDATKALKELQKQFLAGELSAAAYTAEAAKIKEALDIIAA